MSRILRRPMFRGGPVDSRGTGITTGLDQPRSKFEIGGLSSRSNRFFGDTGNVFTSGLALQPVSSFTPRVSRRGRNINPPLPSDLTAKTGVSDSPRLIVDESLMESAPGEGLFELDEAAEFNKMPVGEVDTPDINTKDDKNKEDPDEPEVTMTDLEKALGLDRARQEYAADALAAASKAFFEGKGFGAIADAAAVKSKAPDIKRLAAIEEFKMKGAKDIAQLRKQQKEFAPGNFEKNDRYLQKKYPKLDERERLKILQKKPSTFAEQYIELSKDFGYKNADIFKDAAFLYFGNDYVKDVLTDGDMTIGEPTPSLSDGVYSDAAAELIFVVKDKKVISRKKF